MASANASKKMMGAYFFSHYLLVCKPGKTCACIYLLYIFMMPVIVSQSVFAVYLFNRSIKNGLPYLHIVASIQRKPFRRKFNVYYLK